jgi:exonuclease SbcD
VIIDAVPGKPPKATEIAVTAGRTLMDLEGTIDELESMVAKAGDAYLRVSIHVDQPVPGIADRVRDALPNALDVRLVLPESEDKPSVPVLRGLDPRSQFVAYYQAAHGVEPATELVTAFDRVYDEVSA